MKVMVTGAAGFIGSHLCEKLVETGHQVRAFVHYNAAGRWGWLEESPAREALDVWMGDVRDLDGVKQAMQGVDMVFHLAALIGIPYSYVSPLAYIRTNVEGTYNILQAARELGDVRVVHTSTSEVYGTARYVPIDEEHPLQARSPYAASKIAADQLALSFFRSFGLPVTVIRPFNTFGPRQSARAIIPTILSQALAGRTTLRLGSLSPTRDFNYVKDTVEGFLAVGFCKEAVGQVVNVGSGREVSIGELVRVVGGTLGVSLAVEEDPQRVRPAASEVERLLCDNRKVRELTTWKPRYTLEEGLRETVAWMKEHLVGYKAERYSI